MVRIGIELEVRGGRDVVDQGVIAQGKLILVLVVARRLLHGPDIELMPVLRVIDRGVDEEPRPEDVVPANRAHDVAPVPAQVHPGLVGIVLHLDPGIDLVVAHVEASVKFVTVGELVRHLRVHVVEVVAAGALLPHVDNPLVHHHQRLGEHVIVGAARRDVEGGLSLDDRAFHLELGREQADGAAAMELLVVAVLHADVQDTGETAAETGREAALVEGHVLDGVGVEHREKAHHVVDVVDGYAVKQQQVLVGTAAADIQARRALGARLDARQQLNGLDHVDLAGQGGHALDLVDRDFDGAHLRATHADFGAGGRHGGARQHLGGKPERHVDHGVALQVECGGSRLIADVRPFQRHRPRRQRQCIKTVVVRHGSLLRQLVEQGGADQRLARRGVSHVAADRMFLLRMQRGGGEGRQHEDRRKTRGDHPLSLSLHLSSHFFCNPFSDSPIRFRSGSTWITLASSC